MSLEHQRTEEIKKILLQHKGKANAIAANRISKMLKIPEDDTVPTTRRIIAKIVLDEGWPIGAYDNGYFYIENEQELDDYMNFLEKKILQTTTKKTIVYSNYVKKYGKSSSNSTRLDDF